MTALVGRAVFSLRMTRNGVVDKEMYLVKLALDLFWDDNVTIIPEIDLVDAERQVKQLFKSCLTASAASAPTRRRRRQQRRRQRRRRQRRRRARSRRRHPPPTHPHHLLPLPPPVATDAADVRRRRRRRRQRRRRARSRRRPPKPHPPGGPEPALLARGPAVE
jgi:hypothetical protein